MLTTKRKPLVTKKLSEIVADELESMIRRDEIKEGEYLPSERELMDFFGVGRPSIREALSVLRHKGLIKYNKGEKASVCRPSAEMIINSLSGIVTDFLSTPEGVSDFERLRIFFETHLVRYAAKHATEKDLEKLEKILDIHHNSLRTPDAYAQYDIEFHKILADIPQNKILKTLHSALSEWLISAKPLEKNKMTYENNKKTHTQHIEIFQAIANHDAEKAELLMENHLKHRIKL
ncbi:transcriptional regulator NanR [Proteus faecis]|uniref:Transcriptional regulator NanR n=2 Tax=Gammaproteobacteria TaxID=1236 RepID=A0AAW7CPH3_9GAMM|nr:transcriptional regulator NanR [Proteus faecis]MBG3013423.1 transcriptional regulator NanR [Proteus mirabilis]QNH66499.1 transcriptional regulator NanR [Proteus vulgaris]MCT8250019.1 transcriptional regulator NanR [Proteus faecis]MDL5167579.1 transcriptional regulator NanR [Proteus faecis]MDL5275535.1 transcriptional regulator NanR [Proteus faecis]